jgi:hypothetical protein
LLLENFLRNWRVAAPDGARYADPMLTHGRVAAHAAGTWASRMTEDKGAPVMEGECRVEANSPSGRGVILEVLRVRLDLRFVPGSGTATADGTTEAMLRVASAKITTTPIEVPAYLRGAVWAGVGALTMALVVWLASTAPKPLVSDRGARASNVSAAAGPTVEGAKGAPLQRSLLPELRPVPELAAPAAAPVLAPPPAPQAPAVAPLKKGPPPPRRASAARAESPQSRPESPPPVAAKLASSGDMLDLFEDPK